MTPTPARAGDLAAQLARSGFASPQDAARHLESVALGRDGLVRVVRACADSADPDLAVVQLCRYIAITGRVPSEASVARLAAVLGLSTSLGAFIARHADLASILSDTRAMTKTRTLKGLTDHALRMVARSEQPMLALRLWKRRELLRIAARDLTGEVSVEEVGRELAWLAEAAVRAALADVVGELPAPDGARFSVVGMGKLGGEELNYSSDIDVIYVFDGDDAAQTWATKVGELLIRRLSATTEEGQVFRVDTTLRPEGRSGALVRSIAGYRAYYDKWARPWEFQALIKARPIAGDASLGDEFIELVQPYVYPERLSAEAIREIRGLKARAERALASKGLADREVKRGPGGLRDIEFAVQLLQLVHARRDEGLRSPSTLEALAALAHRAYVGDKDAEELTEAYRFLRQVEHRLQLAQERQTHTVPEDERSRRRLARAMGFRDSPERTALEGFDAAWRDTQRVVRRIHEKLFYRPLLERFAQAPALAPDAAQERLGALGFRQPGRALKFLGDLTAGLSRRAQLMRVMLPVMLDWMSEAPDPDLAVSAFRDVALKIGGNPAALGALRDSPPVVELLCRVLGTSRLLGDYVQHVPEIVAELADPRTLARRSRRQYHEEAAEYVEWRGDSEGRDAALRRMKRRAVLRLACRDLAGAAGPDEIGRELAWLAEAALNAAIVSLYEELPPPPGARFAVIGMGRLGGEELSYASDIDVMFVYDGDDERETNAWANKMGEGLIQRLAATTDEGVAFRVDTGLRPEGKDGALVRSLAGYRAYYQKWAQQWEFQALLKSRFVAGDPTLGQEFGDLVRPYVYREPFPPEALREIRSMKARIERERLGPREDPRTQLKVGAGGLIDVEFTIQLIQLMHAAHNPRLAPQSTVAALVAAVETGYVPSEQGRWLIESYRLLSRIRNRMYLMRGRASDSLPSDEEELEMLARALGYPAPGARVQLMEEYRRATRRARQATEDLFYGGRLGRTRR